MGSRSRRGFRKSGSIRGATIGSVIVSTAVAWIAGGNGGGEVGQASEEVADAERHLVVVIGCEEEDVMTTVEEIMTTDLITLKASDSLEAARTVMMEHNIRHVLIVDDDRALIGLVTHRDVLAASVSKLDPAQDAQRAVFEASTPLKAIMTTGLVVVSEKMNLREAALRLQAHKYGCLPVVSQGKLIGIITDSDFVAVAINLLEQLDLVDPLAETSLEDDL